MYAIIALCHSSFIIFLLANENVLPQHMDGKKKQQQSGIWLYSGNCCFFITGFVVIVRINCGALLCPTADRAMLVFVEWCNFPCYSSEYACAHLTLCSATTYILVYTSRFLSNIFCMFLLFSSSSLFLCSVPLFIYITELKFHEMQGEVYMFILFSFERPYEARKFTCVAASGYYNLIFSLS